MTIQLVTDCLELAFDSLTQPSLQMLVTVRVPRPSAFLLPLTTD